MAFGTVFANILMINATLDYLGVLVCKYGII